jgi:hypothetical protein
MVAHACHPGYSRGRNKEDCSLKTTMAYSLGDPILKILNTKKGWLSGSAVEYLPSKCEVLTSNSSTIKKKRKNIINF